MIVATSASAPAEEASIGAELRELKAQQAALAAKIEALEARVATSATGQAETATSLPPILRLPSSPDAQSAPPTIQSADEGFRVFGTAQMTAAFSADEPEYYTVTADQTAFGLEYLATAEGMPVRVLFEVTPQESLKLRRGFVEVGPVRVGQDFSVTVNDAFVGEGVTEVNFTGREIASGVMPTAGLIQTPMNVVQFRTGGFVLSYEVPLGEAGNAPSPFVAAARYDGKSGPLDWSIGAFADRIGRSEYGIGGSLGGKLRIGRDDLRAYVIGGSGIGDVFGYDQQPSFSQNGQVTRVGGRVSYRHWWSQKLRSNAYYGYIGEQPYVEWGGRGFCCTSGSSSTYRIATERYEENESIGINLIATFRPGLEVGVEGTWGQFYRRQFSRYVLISGPAYPGVPATQDNSYKEETDRYFVFIRAEY